MNTTLVNVSDLHVGSTVALCPPDFELDEGGVYRQSAVQRWLWECWLDFCKQVPPASVAVVNGDVTEGTNVKDIQIVSRQAIDQEDAAVEVLGCLVERVQEIFFIHGTGFHESEDGAMLKHVWRQLHDRFPSKTIHKPTQDLWLRWQGRTIHYAHHRSVSRSPMTQGTPLAGSLAKMLASAPQRGGMYPDVVVRAHAHDPGYLQCAMGLSVGLPAWQFQTFYLWKHAPESVPVIGGTFLVERGGRICVEEILYHVAAPTPRRVTR